MKIPLAILKLIGKLGTKKHQIPNSLDKPTFNRNIGRFHPPLSDTYENVHYQELLDRHNTLIRDIFIEFGLNDSDFQLKIMPIIEHAAKQLHLLPSSKEHHHHTQGGAFHHSLEVAFLALRRSNTVTIHMRYPPFIHDEIKFDLKLAFFVGGLWHDMAKPVTDLKVILNNQQWNPLCETLYDFLQRHHANTYTVSWVNDRQYGNHDNYSAQVFGAFLSKLQLSFHEDIHHEITNHFMNKSGLLTEILTRSDKDSTARDLVKVGNALKRPTPSIEIMDAIRVLASSKNYRVNTGPDYLLVYTNQNLYLRLGDNMSEIYQTLKHKNPDTRCPNDMTTMCQYLSQSGFIEINDKIDHASLEAYTHKLDPKCVPKEHSPCLVFKYVRFTHPFHLLSKVPESAWTPQSKQGIEELHAENVATNGLEEDPRNVIPSVKSLIPKELQASPPKKTPEVQGKTMEQPSKPESSEVMLFTDDDIERTRAKVDDRACNNPVSTVPLEITGLINHLLKQSRRKNNIFKITKSGVTILYSQIVEYFSEHHPDIVIDEYIQAVHSEGSIIKDIGKFDNHRFYTITFSPAIAKMIQQGTNR